MATGNILFTAGHATLPDNSSGNVGPKITRRKGTEADPKKFFLSLDFDPATDNIVTFNFYLPANYASGGTLKILWMANATSGTCRWGAKVSAVTASDADTPLEHASSTAATVGTATNATEARRLNTSSITLNMDSAAAGDFMSIVVYRDADGTSGTDDLSVDAELIAATFEYTTT